MKSGQSLKQRHKHERQESLRELLSKQGHLQQVLVSVEKLENLSEEMESVDIQRLKIAIETRMKLLNKYLPDLKAVEMEISGPEGGAIEGIIITGKPAKTDASN